MTTPDENGWMPIETAPKDETDIMLIRVFGAVAYAPTVAGWWVDGWYSQQFPDDKMDDNFTHWMPLPKPPVMK